MSITRAQVELVLRGRHLEAGTGPQTIDLDDLAQIAARLTCAAGHTFFATPNEIAVALGLTVEESPLIVGLGFCCNGQYVVVEPLEDPLERELLILHGLSQHALATQVGYHTLADVILLAAELAAPANLVLRRGVSRAIQAHRVPAWFLRAWERAVVAPPSSRSFAG